MPRSLLFYTFTMTEVLSFQKYSGSGVLFNTGKRNSACRAVLPQSCDRQEPEPCVPMSHYRPSFSILCRLAERKFIADVGNAPAASDGRAPVFSITGRRGHRRNARSRLQYLRHAAGAFAQLISCL